ncbi:MAG: ester cyclase [Lysobacter sp.]
MASIIERLEASSGARRSFVRAFLWLSAGAVVAPGAMAADKFTRAVSGKMSSRSWQAQQSYYARNKRIFAHGDRAWNARDMAGFMDAHTPDVLVYQPGSLQPRHGRNAHQADMHTLFEVFPDIKLGPVKPDGLVDYKMQVADGNWMAAISHMTGTFEKTLPFGAGKIIQPNGKRFGVDLATIARMTDEGMIAEEYLFYDQFLMFQQLELVEMKGVVDAA